MGILQCVKNDEKERRKKESDNSVFLFLFPGKNFLYKTVLQTDTGGQVENTKVLGRILVKELGKMPL